MTSVRKLWKKLKWEIVLSKLARNPEKGKKFEEGVNKLLSLDPQTLKPKDPTARTR